MKQVTWILAAAAALAGGCETQDRDRVNETTPIAGPTATSGQGQDADFLRTASHINQAEVDAGRMAMERAIDPEVRRFGEMLANDHRESLQELEQLASQQDIALPQQLDNKHQQMLSRLSQLQGAQFDREFINEMVKRHEEAISRFENQMRSGRDAQAKSYAANAIPSLREHLRIAREIEARLASGRSATGMDEPIHHQDHPQR
jgi:putative membrane protein